MWISLSTFLCKKGIIYDLCRLGLNYFSTNYAEKYVKIPIIFFFKTTEIWTVFFNIFHSFSGIFRKNIVK